MKDGLLVQDLNKGLLNVSLRLLGVHSVEDLQEMAAFDLRELANVLEHGGPIDLIRDATARCFIHLAVQAHVAFDEDEEFDKDLDSAIARSDGELDRVEDKAVVQRQ